jgi:hypothetical protein
MVKNATVARVAGTRKSLAKSKLAKANPTLRKHSDAAKKAYADYKAGRVPGLAFSAERKFGDLMKNAIYKKHKAGLVK